MTSVSINHLKGVGQQSQRLAFGFSAAIVLPLVWLRRMRQRRELANLMGSPDYLMKDVGLQRDAISREALKPFWMA